MSNIKDLKAIERIEESIANLKDNNFNIYFFVVDSRNVPNSSLAYIYELANKFNHFYNNLYSRKYKEKTLK